MIKINTEMPRSCAECFALVGDELHDYVCKLTGHTIKDAEFIEILSKKPPRLNNCPLQEDNTELKPCPFCGSAVELKKSPMWRTYSDGTTHGYKDCYELEIACPKCGCSTFTTKGDTVNFIEENIKDYIIKNWNARWNENNE